MATIFKNMRIKKGLTMEDAAEKIFISKRSLHNYENRKQKPSPDIVCKMAEVYDEPMLTNTYCRDHCPIGHKYSYEILNNVNLDIPTIIIKLRSEMKEAMAIMDDLLDQSVNDAFKNDLEIFEDNIQELLDVEHNIEVLKIQLHQWLRVESLISDHNRKCVDRNYCKKEAQ